jgi:hypothetical protein
MDRTLEPLNLSIVIAAHNHNPTILNPDFLYRNKIVPDGWKLAQGPICTPPMARVSFENGTVIEAQFDKLIFTDGNPQNIPEASSLGQVALKYVETLPHVSYAAVGVNPHGYVSCDSDESVRLFMMEKLISSGPWREAGDKPVHASVSLIYAFGDCRCTLSIDEWRFRPGELANETPVISFRANFHRDLAGQSHDEKLDYLRKTICNWRQDYDAFCGIIRDNFLKEADPCIQQ